IAPILSEEEVFNVFAGIKSLNDLPLGESLTVHFGQFIDDSTRQAQLTELMSEATPELRLLLGGAAKRTRELTETGIRKVNFLNLFVTYTVDEGVEPDKGDFFDRILAGGEKTWYQLTGSYGEVKRVAIQEILLEAYQRGFGKWQRLLTNQIGLSIQPMSEAEMRYETWRRFNRSPLRPLNRVIIDVHGGSFKEQQISEVHPKSYLLESEVPVAHRKWVKAKGRYTGVLLFGDKPDVEGDEIDELFFLHEIFSKETLYDTELITQIRRGNSSVLKDKMSSLTKQAQNAARYASEKGEIDVGASLSVERAIDAQTALYQDEEPFHTATVILVHRPSVRLVNRACADLQSYFRRDGWVVREEEYAWRVWLQTFPQLCWDRLLGKPFNRQRTYVTSELPRILPLVCNNSQDTDGFEFLAEEGQCPIYLPLYQRHFNTGIFAASGSGKSVLMSDILCQLLPYRDMASTVLEFPRKDGSGSFDGLCQYLPEYCTYVDMGDGDVGWNVVEPPNLRGFSRKEQQERFADFKEELLDILVALVMGFKRGASLEINEDTVRSILLLVIETFYEDVEIRERFGTAFRHGFGSTEWRQMPTLVEVLAFVSLERLQLSAATGEILKTLEYIKLRLRSWLESRLGKLLSRTTTFRTDARMMVVALRGLNNDTDASIIGSLSYLGAFRRSLTAPRSVFAIDEAPILLDFDPLAISVGRVSANGRKSGIRLILVAQGIGSILKCAAADKIFDNMEVKITGRVHSQSVDHYVTHFKYPYGLIAENASEKYGINHNDRYSRWLYDNGSLVPVRHYPSAEIFSLVANGMEEASLRRNFWQSYKGDRVQGLYQLTNQFTQRKTA
ncbi:hypothetical protein C7H19_19920, partial [Aphanothece hegewaldii CCALA 016]